MPDPTEGAAAGEGGGAPVPPSAAPPMGAPAAAPQAQGPGGGPMLTPQKMAGKAMAAKVKVQVALHALMLAAQETGVMSDEGRAILDAVQKLTKAFGKTEDQSKQLMPAELAQIMQQAKPAAMNPALAGAIRPQAPPPMAA